MKQDCAFYETAKKNLDRFLNEEPLGLQMLDRATLEHRAMSKPYTFKCGGSTLEQKCVNYLRHRASVYDDILKRLYKPDSLSAQGIDQHVLHVERRRAIAVVKKRILDEIGEQYPWLRPECNRQKQRDGVEDEPGDFILPFGPFKGYMLRDISADYLVGLLGQGSVRKSFRTRIERHLAERFQQADHLRQAG